MKVYLLVLFVFSVATALPSATDEVCRTMKEAFMKKIQTRVARNFVPLSSVKKSSFHSCDIDGNRVLEGPEFAGCLHPLVTESIKLSEEALVLRLDCFRKFKRQADKNDDGMVTKEEFDNWTKLGFFDMVLEASEQANNIENPDITDMDVLIDETPVSSRQVKEVAGIIKALVKGDTGLAIVRVYGLLSGTDVGGFDPLLIQAVRNVLVAIGANDIPTAIGNVFSIVAGVLIRGQTQVVVTQATIAAVGSILTSIINSDNAALGGYVGTAVTGILVDIGHVTQATAHAISQIVVSLVTNTFDGVLTDAIITTLVAGLSEGIASSEAGRNALIALIKGIRDNNTNLILANVFVVIAAVAGQASGVGEAAGTHLSLIVTSLIANDRTAAAQHTATLYNALSGGGSCGSGFGSFFG